MDGRPTAGERNEFTFRLNEGNVERHALQRLESFVDCTAGKRLTCEAKKKRKSWSYALTASQDRPRNCSKGHNDPKIDKFHYKRYSTYAILFLVDFNGFSRSRKNKGIIPLTHVS
jgi:hypothetical protein